MDTKALAPVFLDDQPVTLQDARPKVSAILAAVGKPDATQVKWLKASSDTLGKTLRPEEVVDRTADPGKAIYLTSGAKGLGSAPFGGKGQGTQARPGQGSAGWNREGKEPSAMKGGPDGPEKGKAADLQVEADAKARSAYADPASETRGDDGEAAGEGAKPSGDDEKRFSSG